jgi:uncharacterized protein (DUF1778 family)
MTYKIEMTNTERGAEAQRLLARLRELIADGDLPLDASTDLAGICCVDGRASLGTQVKPGCGSGRGGEVENPYLAIMRTVMEQSLGAANEADRVERFSARISKDQKDLLERAAELQDRTLTDFVMSAAQAEAERVVRDRMAVTLSAFAFDAFADACIGANGEPNEALRNAAERQKKRVRSS